MKRTRCILMIIAAGWLTLGPGYAGEPPAHAGEKESREGQTADGRPVEQTSGNGGGMHHAHPSITKIGSAPPKSSQVSPTHTQSKSTPGNEVRQPAPRKEAPAASGGLVTKKAASLKEPIAKLPTGAGISGSSPGIAHSRPANVASIGGVTASSSLRGTAAIRGNDIKRKP